MLFNSFEFFSFFIIVFSVNLITPFRFRWLILLVASYYFYACWNPTYLILIFLSTVVDYIAASRIYLSNSKKIRTVFLILSLSVNLGLLFTFKYFNFFSESLQGLVDVLSLSYQLPSLDVVLPIGISFYTFQTLSYTIDVYQRHQTPEPNFWRFALYVSYFPQLVAGPIERSHRLLPQLRKPKPLDMDRFHEGLQLILWGLFKKVVVADTLAVYVNAVYDNHFYHGGLSLLVATYLFAFQIYCDFSGYSDIAIGTAKIFGVDLMKNFKTPYFSRSITEFWKRWHISLSSWFRDYLYIPLGGNRVSAQRVYINILIVFLVSGLWHGANWKFVVWGWLHGLLLSMSVATLSLRLRIKALLGISEDNRLLHFIQILITFHFVVLFWVFFRAENLQAAFDIILKILSFSGKFFFDPGLLPCFLSLVILLVVDMTQVKVGLWSKLQEYSILRRWSFNFFLIFYIILFGIDGENQFIYFQF